MISQRMSMRLYTERPTTTTNDWGNKSAPTYADNLSGELCWVYVKGGSERDRERDVANVYDLIVLVLPSADINEDDRVKKIEDRLGNQKYGRMKIVGIIDRHKYKEVLLSKWGGE